MRTVLILLLVLPFGLLLSAEDQSADETRLLAALSDDRPVVHTPAMRALRERGPVAVPSLSLLAADAGDGVRVRVAQVLGSIGGSDAAAVLLRLAQDPNTTVRAYAVLALGESAVPQALQPLQAALNDPQATVRESAAIALAMQAHGSSVLPILAAWDREEARTLRPGAEQDARQRTLAALQRSLEAHLQAPSVVPAVAELLPRVQGLAAVRLLRATGAVGDPRLCLALSQVAVSDQPALAELAVASLGANGDSRCVQALSEVAAHAPEESLRILAAATLRRLTGYQAGPGEVWSLWWRDHASAVRALYPRDAFIAALYDPQHLPQAEELAAFSPSDLQPLVEGALGDGAAYWPALALRALKLDQGERWREPLWEQLETASDEARRVRLLALVGGLGLVAPLRERLAARAERLRQDQRAIPKSAPKRPSSEIAILELLLGAQS